MVPNSTAETDLQATYRVFAMPSPRSCVSFGKSKFVLMMTWITVGEGNHSKLSPWHQPNALGRVLATAQVAAVLRNSLRRMHLATLHHRGVNPNVCEVLEVESSVFAVGESLSTDLGTELGESRPATTAIGGSQKRAT